jgi:hypothetical protein
VSAAAVIIIIKPPRLAAMSGNQSFTDELERAEDIGNYYSSNPTENAGIEELLLAIVVAMCGNSATELANANDELWPLPT